MANVLRRSARKLNVGARRPALQLHPPHRAVRPRRTPHYHWHIEIIPRLTKVAGFEWGSGFYINPTPPEEAAGFLREIANR